MSRVLPILFNTDMVRAILTGRKTVTRRCVKYKYDNTEMKIKTDKYGARLIEIQKDIEGETFGRREDGTTWHKLRGYIEPKPPYQRGDILYVRETWAEGCEEGTYIYKADDKLAELPEFKKTSRLIYRPSIHMPKVAARIWLKVTDVRVERLQEITNKEAKQEGVAVESDNSGIMHRLGFAQLWDSTIKKSDLGRYGWEANPWVWVIEFEQCEKPIQEGEGT